MARISIAGGELKKAISWGTKGLATIIEGVDAGGAVAIINASGSDLTIKSYDGEKFFQAQCQGSGLAHEESFEVMVLGSQLKPIGDALDAGDPVSIEPSEGGDSVTFSSPNAKYELETSRHAIATFPNIPPKLGTISVSELSANARKQAGVCVTGDENRAIPALSAVLFEFHPLAANPFLRLQSTDRMVMLVRDIPYVANADFDIEAALPDNHSGEISEDTIVECKVVSNHVRTLFSGAEFSEDVDLHMSDNLFGISGNNFFGFVTTLNAPSIPYQRLTEENNESNVTIVRKEFMNAINKIKTINNSTSGKFLSIDFFHDKTVVGSLEGKASVAVPSDSNLDEGPPVTMRFDAALLTKIVQSATTECVHLTFSSPTNKPLYLYESDSLGTVDPTYSSLAMPRSV